MPPATGLAATARKALAFGLAALAACTKLAPASDIIGTADGAMPTDCTPRRPPPRPTSPDGPDVSPFHFIIRDVVLDQRDGRAWARIGFDLDGICTRSPNPMAECENAAVPTDGEDGIDNVFGQRIYPLFEVLQMGYQEAVREMHGEGRNALFIGVHGWNGLPDDPHVEIWVATTVGTVAGAASDSGPPSVVFDDVGRPFFPGREPAPLPAWEGNDWAFVRSDSFADGRMEPLLIVDNAYTVGGLFVARLPPRSEFLFFSSDRRPERLGRLLVSRVRLTDGTVVFRRTADGIHVSDGVLAGRWSVRDALSTGNEVGVCEGSPLGTALADQFIALADVRATPPAPGEFLRCDALSMGVAFGGTLVRFGGVVMGPSLPNVCAELAADGGVPGADAGTDDGGVPVSDAEVGDM
jgi:hypothetical protein